MAFHNDVFPTDYNLNAVGGPGFNTQLFESPSGSEKALTRYESAKREWKISYKGTRTEVQKVVDFFQTKKGSRHTFLFKDWTDFTSHPDGESTPGFSDQLIGNGDGVKDQFQIVKNYDFGLNSDKKNITKLVPATLRVAHNGVEITSGWVVDVLTGIITFLPILGAGPITVGYEYYNHVRFHPDTDKRLDVRKTSQHTKFISDIVIIESPDESELSTDLPGIGATHVDLGAIEITLNIFDGGVFNVVPDTTGRSLKLPDYTNLALGSRHIFIKANAHPFTVKDHLGNTIISATVNDKVYQFMVGLISGGLKRWFVLNG